MCSSRVMWSEMCLSRVMWSEIMKPRLRAQVVNGMSGVPTRREAGWASGKSGSVWLHDDSFCLVIQFQFALCHPGLYFRDACLHSQDSDVCLIKTGQDWSSCVLSAKGWLEAEWASVKEEIGAECTGQKTEPMEPHGKQPHVLNSGHWQSQSRVLPVW